jgi:hypothetical protein
VRIEKEAFDNPRQYNIEKKMPIEPTQRFI